MTWVEEYRRKVGMNRREFAEAITRKLGGRGDRRVVVTPAILTILEEWPSARTHPRIINVIARACGATKQQRDQFLHPSRREWPYMHGEAQVKQSDGHPWRKHPGATTEAARASAAKFAAQSRAVVIVDKKGEVVARVPSIKAAAEFMGMNETCVSDRCKGLTRAEFADGKLLTCRYADKWDAMTQEQRAGNIAAAIKKSKLYSTRHIVAIDRRGNVRQRYGSIKEAAEAELTSPPSVRLRCLRKLGNEWTKDREVTYRYEDQWDKMTRAQQMRDIGAAL